MAKTICECGQSFDAWDAFSHYYKTRHTMTYKGVVQNFDSAVKEQDAIRDAYMGRRESQRKDDAA